MSKRARQIIPHPTDPSLALVQLTKGYFATISIIDAAEVGKTNWCAAPKETQVYAVRRQNQIRPQYLHHFIAELAGISTEQEVDHENNNGLDCRRSNLRAASRSQNANNIRTPRHNTSGIKGVHWSTRRERWIAQLVVDGRGKYLGQFLSKE